MPKLLYFLRTGPCFLQNDYLQRYDNLLSISLCKITDVKMDDKQFLQLVLPAAKDGLGVSSVRVHSLPAFLASAVGAKYALSKILIWSMWMEPIWIELAPKG